MKKLITILFTILLVVSSSLTMNIHADELDEEENTNEEEIIEVIQEENIEEEIPLESLEEDQETSEEEPIISEENEEEVNIDKLFSAPLLTVPNNTKEPLQTGSCGDNATYTIYEDNSMVISGSGSIKNRSTFNPSITSLYDKITSVVIEEGITSIGSFAFNGFSSLTSISIPNSVTSIGNNALFGCSSLTNIALPSSLLSIDNNAFMNCRSLESINIPKSVTSIGFGITKNCSSLESITVDSANTVYDSRDNCNAIIETATNTLIQGCNYSTIPNTVEKIGNSAFYNCSLLTSISIPDKVTSIGDDAFSYCESLTDITLPSSLTTLGDYVFCGCSSLKSIEIPKLVTEILELTFSDCSSLEEIIIPSTVSYIEYNAFQNCTALKSITLPEEITTISDSLFNGCESLESIVIPSKVTEIENYAFNGCKSLKSVDIKGSLESIGQDAFHDCSALSSINIPSTVTSIGDGAFYGCKQLTSFVIPSLVTTIEDNTFSFCSNLNSITIPEGVTSIGNSAFANCDEITSIKIPFSVNSIGDKAFESCGFESLTIPSSVSSIGSQAFQFCSDLKSIYLPKTVKTIGKDVFYFCRDDDLTIYTDASSGMPGWDETWCVWYDNPRREINVIFNYPVTDCYDPNKFEIIFDGNGATSGLMDGMNNLKYGETYTLATNTYSRNSFEFVSWNTKADGTGVSFEDAQEINFAKGEYSSPITLYAIWESSGYSINYVLGYDDVINNNPASYTIEDEITLTNPVLTGYTFNGWFLDSSYKKPITLIKKGSTNELTIYAKWKVNTYKISYTLEKGVTNGAKNPTTFTYSKDGVIYLNNATKKGYKFLGFYDENDNILPYDNELDKYYLSTNHDGDYKLKAVFSDEYENYNINYLGELGSFTDSNPNPSVYTYNSAKITLKNPTRDGYTFSGWYDLNTNKKVTTIANHSMGSYRLEARWSENSYKLAYNVNTGKVDKATPLPKTLTYKYTSEVYVTDVTPSKAGYDFIGWSLKASDKEALYKANDDITGINATNKAGATITLYAIYKPIAHTLTLNPSGGVLANKQVYDSRLSLNGDIYEMTYDITTSSIKLPNLTKNGYKFDGWYSNISSADGTIKYDKNSNEVLKKYTSVSKYYCDMDLTALYSPVTYKITYNTNKGTLVKGSSYDTTYSIESYTIDLPSAEEITRKGYTFDGWYLDKDFKTPSSELTNEYAKNVTLYAKWVANSYTVTLVSDDYIEEITLDYDETRKLDNDIFKAPGKTVAKWSYSYVDAKGKMTTKSIAGNASIKNLCEGTPEDNNIVLSVLKDKNNKESWTYTKYTIKYVLNGGTNPKANKTSYTAETVMELLDPSRKDASFEGWYDNPNYEGYPITSTEGIYSNMTLYASYTDKLKSISYKNIDGIDNSSNPDFYMEGGAVTLAKLSRKGYTFDGWYLDEALTKKASITAKTEGDLTLYAKWTPIKYTITYNVNTGKGKMNKTVFTYDEDSDLTLSECLFTKSGYTFKCWNTKKDGKGISYTPDTLLTDFVDKTKTITLYAIWSK